MVMPYGFLLLLPVSASLPGNFALVSPVPITAPVGDTQQGQLVESRGLCCQAFLPAVSQGRGPCIKLGSTAEGVQCVISYRQAGGRGPPSSTPSFYLKGTGQGVPTEEYFFLWRLEVTQASHPPHCLPPSQVP